MWMSALIALAAAVQLQEQPPFMQIPKISQPPVLQDFLQMKPGSEAASRMTKVTGFLQRAPRDGEPATQPTDVYAAYDDSNVYFVFVCFDSEPEKVRARMFPRGASFTDDDWVHVVLDTFNDQRRAYMFSVYPLGIQWDALFTEGQGADANFDALFESDGAVTDQGYVTLIAIPFKSLRFQPGEMQQWGVLFGRNIPRLNEQSFWPQYSSRIEGRLNQAARLTGLDGISPGRNIQLLPYAGFRSYRAIDRRDPVNPRFAQDNAVTDGGVDAKFVLRDSVVMDFALNPDFSQVESDEPQVTTNQRFEVFFPEKRPFFLENASYFRTPINLLFTRRIADPQFGARLTGKIGQTAFGVLAADDQSPGKAVTDDHPDFGSRAKFGVVRVSRDILNQSSIGMIYTHRAIDGAYNRVGGVDSRLKLNTNWVAELQAVTSTTRQQDGSRRSGPAYEALLNRNGRLFNMALAYSDRGQDFLTLTGFNPRQNLRTAAMDVSYAFRPEGRRWISTTPSFGSARRWTHDGKPLDETYSFGLNWEFVGRTFVNLSYQPQEIGLRPGEAPVSSIRTFKKRSLGGSAGTSLSRQVQVETQYFRGTDINYNPRPGTDPSLEDWTNASLTLTFRPVTQLTVANRYLFTKLASRGTEDTIFNDHIVRSRWTWQFTREFSVRFIAQYNALLVNPSYTALETRKNINADVLFAYQLNAWTALYVGYNNNLQNIDLIPTATGSRVIRRPTDFTNDAHQFFAKFSYLIRF
jgi:hypothetical protein